MHYDYDVLLDGQTRELERGIHYYCLDQSMRQNLLREARRRGITAEVYSAQRAEDGKTVLIVKANLDP